MVNNNLDRIAVDQQRLSLKDNQKCIYSSKTKIEYSCKTKNCSCGTRFLLITGNWTKQIRGDEHNHDNMIDDGNQPNDNTGLSEAEKNILEAIIQELGDPKTRALKKIGSLWHLKYASFRLNGGAVVVPFPDQKKVQYRLNNRLRGSINDDTIDLAKRPKKKKKFEM